MKLFKIFALLLLAIALCFPAKISAVKAYPFPFEVQQPNGETITIQAHGDEFFHYATTVDGYIIDVDNEGYFTFAEINSEGYIQAGKVRVSENVLKSGNNSLLKANSPEFIQKIKQPALSRRVDKVKNITALRSANMLRSTNNIAAGDTKALIILAEFSGKPFSISNPKQAFTNMLNAVGYSPSGASGFTGSVREYFIRSSDGKYSPQFDVYGPVQLPHDMAFYGENDAKGLDKNPGQMIIDACNEAVNNHGLNLADFPRYEDKDGNITLDNVCVIYSGYNEAETSTLSEIWPHQYYLDVKGGFSLSERTVGGVALDSYMCTSELRGASGNNMAGIGTFTHEYGHVLGLPDLYDANGSKDGTVITEPGDWDIMSSGNYLNSGNTPPSYSAIERWWLDWIKIYYLDSGKNVIPPIISSAEHKAYIVETPTEEYEFFILEVRNKEGWDSELPGEGMLIYHIDMSDFIVQTTDYGDISIWELWGAFPNIVDNRPGMKLITANGDVMTRNSNSSYSYKNYGGHPFPGANGVTSISDDTNPGFLSWNNEKSGVSITNIVRNPTDGSVSFTYSKTSVGIKENNLNSPFAFSNDNVIYFKNISGNTQVNVYDMKGILYLSKNIYEPDNREIAVPGIYIVKLQTNNEVFTYKIIIR